MRKYERPREAPASRGRVVPHLLIPASPHPLQSPLLRLLRLLCCRLIGFIERHVLADPAKRESRARLDAVDRHLLRVERGAEAGLPIEQLLVRGEDRQAIPPFE